MPRTDRQRPIADRLWERVDRTGKCWLWTGWTDKRGYGQIALGGRHSNRAMVYRVAYELLVGPIPEGLVIDHLCRNPRCVRPSHLEAVTQGENVARGLSPRAVAARREACGRGHPYSPENTYVRPNGNKQCRVCKRLRVKARDLRPDELEESADAG